VGDELFYAKGEAEADMKKPIIVSRNFEEEPKNEPQHD